MRRRLVFLSSSSDLAKTREDFEFRMWNNSLDQLPQKTVEMGGGQ